MARDDSRPIRGSTCHQDGISAEPLPPDFLAGATQCQENARRSVACRGQRILRAPWLAGGFTESANALYRNAVNTASLRIRKDFFALRRKCDFTKLLIFSQWDWEHDENSRFNPGLF